MTKVSRISDLLAEAISSRISSPPVTMSKIPNPVGLVTISMLY
jgi:hypothetical protein